MTSVYVNPIPGSVTPERIDQGVDYAGSGNLLAIGDGVVTQVNGSGSGWPGSYIAYKLTSGPLSGREIYYAEGVTSHVKVGQRLSAGQIVASIIPAPDPRAAHGIEVGYGSGQQDTSYARGLGGGYTEGHSTAAGQAFSDLIKQLGGPAGVPQAGSVTGTAAGLAVPQGISGGQALAGASATTTAGTTTTGGGVLGTVGGALTDLANVTGYPQAKAAENSVAGAITGALNGIFTSIVNDAKYAALALLLIVGGFVLLGKGVSRATHAEG